MVDLLTIGKFGSARNAVLYALCCAMWSNDSTGSVEAPTGYVWRISNTVEDTKRANLEFSSVLEAVLSEDLAGYGIEDTDALRADITGNFLVVEDSNGFISVHSFDTEAQVIEAFNAADAAYSAWEGAEDE